MTIRSATSQDFSDLYTLWQAADMNLYPLDVESVRYEAMLLLNPDLCIVIQDEAGQIVGSILGGFDGRSASVNRLAVLPDFQKQGLGSQLIAEVEKRLAARDIHKWVIQIHVNNTQVVPFYEKLGFKEMTYVKMYYKDF